MTAPAPPTGALAWRPFVRSVDRLSLALVAFAAGLAATLLGGWGALSALAGGALLLGDLHLLAWLVAGALSGRLSRRSLVWAAVPFKFLALAAAVWAALLLARLDPLAFGGGVTAVVTALLAAAVRHAPR
jgi:hypothetical protein